MPGQLRGRAGVVPILILVMLASLAVSQAIGRFSESIGVDFYHFWGVPVAMRMTGHTLGSPYREGERYQAVLTQFASTISQPRLGAAQRFWSAPDFTGSPLLYQVFSVVSEDYTFSLGVFRTVQILSFLGACLLLGSLHRFDPFHLLCFALIGLVVHQPLLSDLRVGNLGCVQLAVLAAVMGLASALLRARSSGRRAGLAAACAVILASLTLCKPTIVLVSVLLALHLAVRHGARVFARAALPALVVTVLLLIVPCLYFGSWTVWQDWYRFVYGSDARMLVRPITSGNYSTPLLLSSWLGGDIWVIAVVLFVLLVVSLVVVCRPDRRTPPARTVLEAARTAFYRLFGDPHRTVALGILLTMATSPLSWVHYHVLLLIPSLWLLNAVSTGTSVPALAATSVVMTAGIAGMLLWGLGWPTAMAATIALGWVPLWGALLIDLRSWDGGASGAAMTAGVVASPSRRQRTK